MALNFPTSPALNDEYTFDSKTWVWNGTAWALKVAQAADLLAMVKTVDGAGSGLDADLLDGKHASEFLDSSAIGVSVQPYDTDLTAWASKTAPTGTVVGATDEQTLTNKNIQERVVSYTDATSVTIVADTTDIAKQTNTQVAGTLTVGAPTGTPFDGQKLMLRLQSTNVQTFVWNAIFTGSTDLPLPTATSGSSKYDYIGFMYNSTAAKWQIIAKNFGF